MAAAESRNDPGVDFVGVKLRAMAIAPLADCSATNIKHRIARLMGRARCERCPPYDVTRAPNDQAPRCADCLLRRALNRRPTCARCHRELSVDAPFYRVERVGNSWRTKLDPQGRKIHRDRNAANGLRLVVSVAAQYNGKRPVEYTHAGNK